MLVKYVASVIFSFTHSNNIEKDLPALMEKILVKDTIEEKVAVFESELQMMTKKYITTLKAIFTDKKF